MSEGNVEAAIRVPASPVFPDDDGSQHAFAPRSANAPDATPLIHAQGGDPVGKAARGHDSPPQQWMSDGVDAHATTGDPVIDAALDAAVEGIGMQAGSPAAGLGKPLGVMRLPERDPILDQRVAGSSKPTRSMLAHSWKRADRDALTAPRVWLPQIRREWRQRSMRNPVVRVLDGQSHGATRVPIAGVWSDALPAPTPSRGVCLPVRGTTARCGASGWQPQRSAGSGAQRTNAGCNGTRVRHDAALGHLRRHR